MGLYLKERLRCLLEIVFTLDLGHGDRGFVTFDFCPGSCVHSAFLRLGFGVHIGGNWYRALSPKEMLEMPHGNQTGDSDTQLPMLQLLLGNLTGPGEFEFWASPSALFKHRVKGSFVHVVHGSGFVQVPALFLAAERYARLPAQVPRPLWPPGYACTDKGSQ